MTSTELVTRHVDGYRALGFSIIPIIPPGDGQDGKHPAIAWKPVPNQTCHGRRARDWFSTTDVDRHCHRRDQRDRRGRC